MSNKIILKKSSIHGKMPMVSDLEYGELAINYKDGLLFYKTADNTISSISNNTVSIDGGASSSVFLHNEVTDGGLA